MVTKQKWMILYAVVVMTAMNCVVSADVVSADIDGDGAVSLPDVAAMAGAWQTAAGQAGFDGACDLDNDNDVDSGDLYIFVNDWLGESVTPVYLTMPTARDKSSFNVGWKFYKGAITSDAASAASYDDSSWTTVNVPHNPPIGTTSYDPLRPSYSSGYSYEGVSWYRRHFYLDSSKSGSKIFIEFEAANTVTDVWINGTQLATHSGGYLPFTYDITGYVNFGATENVIAVKVDNTDNTDVPPGKTDWFNWGGIYRDVWLHTTDKLYVTDAVYANAVAGGGIFVTYPYVSTASAQVQVKTQVKNEYATAKSCTLRSFIADAEDVVVAQMSTTQSIAAAGASIFTQTATIVSPHLWHPHSPYLYTLYTEVYDGDTAMDTYRTRIGIRSVSFTKAGGFKINGEVFKFRGTNRMQDYPYVGYAMGNAGQRRDAEKIKAAGFDYVRTSHYPQDPAFMDACDELGLLVMDAIPGFQYMGGTTFKNNSYQNMRDMLRRDRNHPCVIAWELSLNEMWWTDTDYSPMAVSIGHAEYPGSFISAWKDDTIYDIFIATPSAGARTYTGTKPLIVSEYGHWEYGGDGCYSDVHRGNVGSKYYYGESAMIAQAANHQDGYNQNLAMSNLCGDGLWVGIDYGPYPSGVLDIYRLPKFSYYFWQSQRDADVSVGGVTPGAMVYIANYWTSSSPTTVTVFSNCQQVRLYRNGVLYATQTPDAGTNLPHPPFTFTGLTYASGQLMAEGLIDGEVAATHLVCTPGSTNALQVVFDQTDVQANGSDYVFVYAYVVDSDGTLVVSSSKTVTFTVAGEATLFSPASVKAEAGIAFALIRVTDTPGAITVTAKASGLTSGSAVITTR